MLRRPLGGSTSPQIARWMPAPSVRVQGSVARREAQHHAQAPAGRVHLAPDRQVDACTKITLCRKFTMEPGKALLFISALHPIDAWLHC